MLYVDVAGAQSLNILVVGGVCLQNNESEVRRPARGQLIHLGHMRENEHCSEPVFGPIHKHPVRIVG